MVGEFDESEGGGEGGGEGGVGNGECEFGEEGGEGEGGELAFGGVGMGWDAISYGWSSRGHGNGYWNGKGHGDRNEQRDME